MTRTKAILALSLVAALSDCTCGRGRKEDDDEPDPGPALPALTAPSPVASLPLAGFGDAVVALPVGATRPVPVLVAVLGIGDTPEEQCAAWRDVIEGSRAFVLCPRGAKNMVQDPPVAEVEAGEVDPDSPSQDPPSPEDPKPRATAEGGRLRQVGFYPVDVPTLDREVTAGLAALKARYGAHVSDHDAVYAGFSRGAFLGASLGAKYPQRFGRLVLIEGGQSPWQPQTAAAFARGGGKRVLFVCGQQDCVEDAQTASTTLRAQKLETRVVHGVGGGHSYKRQVREELRRSFDWVTEGARAWRSR